MSDQGATAGGTRRVLLVDDNPAQLKLGRLHLEQAGFVVHTASCADEALAVARGAPPDAILSDVLMDDLDGFTLCRLLKEEPALRDVPIVLVSAHFNEDADRALAADVGASSLVFHTPDFHEELQALELGWSRVPPPRRVDSTAACEAIARRVARELHRARTRLDACEAARFELEAFGHSVAHDLQAPIRRIDGFALALEEDCGAQLDATGKHYLKRVRHSAGEMSEIVEALLVLSLVTQCELRLEPIDLGTLARAVLSRLLFGEPPRQTEIVIAEGVTATADRALLDVLLTNLLANAWKFTGKKERTRIEVGSVADRAGRTIYFVKDNGAGFDMAGASKLFNAFQRLHSTREFAGSGIGLATAARVVRRHGGLIWAEAEVERGATFYFTLRDSEIRTGAST